MYIVSMTLIWSVDPNLFLSSLIYPPYMNKQSDYNRDPTS